ncbi:MAG: hypothetical protein LC794_09645 [Acidobacteria bacterium]|nr:hypothetical protein [Acidobacteriota bacterium]
MDQQTSIEPKQTIEWLNKLIVLAQWNRKLPFHTVRLLTDPPNYQAFLTRVRASPIDKTQLTDFSTETWPTAVARRKLLEAVAAVPALRELFGSDQDPFKDARPAHLELLAEVSDVTAESQKMVYSRNGTLEAVIAGMRTTGVLDPNHLIVNDLNKFLTLLETGPAAANEKSTAELLYDLAMSPNWYIVMASLRASRDYTGDEEASVVNVLTLWREKIAKQTLQQLFLNPGHLSRAPKKLIRLAWEHRELFAEARARIPENAREKKPDDERKQVANSALLLFDEKFKLQVDEIRSDLNVLATVASHFVNVRKFAKFDGFVYTWPEIARLCRANYAALKYVEELLLNRMPPPTDADLDAREARELYMLIDRDDRLKRFMRIRPHFREISENELMQYRPLAPVVMMTSRPVTAVPESVNFVAQHPLPSPVPPSPAPQAPLPSLPKVLQVQTLSLEKAQGAPPSDGGITYDVNFSMLGNTLTGPVKFRVEKLLEKILAAMGVSSDSGLQEVLKELFASDSSFAEERIRRGSVELAMNVLPVTLYKPLSEVLATPSSLRLVVNSSEREIHYLPWEWWPTSTPGLALRSPDHSVVRSVKSATQNLPMAMLPPLRLMSFIPDTPTGTRFTSDITLKTLEEIASGPGTQYRALTHEEATWKNLQHELESFRPHIVHFEGTWMVSYQQVTNDHPGHYEGVQIYLSDRTPRVEEFSDLLRNSGVNLLVIGRNGVSTIFENPCASAAFELAKRGVSVLAPMRAIDDASATTFTTDFYGAFLAGNKLESALYIARRNLASKGSDWTVFALFTEPDRLQYLELVRPSA